MKRPRSAAAEDILQGLFGTWLDLSDLSTDREKKAFTSSTLRLSTFEAKEWMSLENFCFVFTYNLLLWRSIVTCNWCNIVSSHMWLTYTNETFCTMSFNRKLVKFFGGKYLIFLFLRGRRANFEAHAMLRLLTANLLLEATLT